MFEYIEKTLVLSTTHMPEDDPDFGESRVTEHDYGWIVFLQTDNDLLLEESPEWLVPVIEFALENDCSMINFDRDGITVEDLPTWEW